MNEMGLKSGNVIRAKKKKKHFLTVFIFARLIFMAMKKPCINFDRKSEVHPSISSLWAYYLFLNGLMSNEASHFWSDAC